MFPSSSSSSSSLYVCSGSNVSARTGSRTLPPLPLQQSPAMGALAADFGWTREEIFKLKTAAQLSKQFIIQELHDRWHVILDDPVVAAEASARMLEY
ncbi:hypothetical protein L2E82_44032 [Cichorium intybus]|uniref:Uncharacterized protein n=1 Tax=Cichorium intybus TaxID=13427 RepID=A0ACB8ZPS7_CICIN|nr:hypothetical protein L2E82_44032 [Cichorium intybus]